MWCDWFDIFFSHHDRHVRERVNNLTISNNVSQIVLWTGLWKWKKGHSEVRIVLRGAELRDQVRI